jgi:membrane associated rhomboid family serine protease
MQARINPLSNLQAKVGLPQPATLARPYSFAEDIRRVWRIPPPATRVLFLISVIAFIGQVLGGSSNWQRAAGLIPANVADALSFLRVGDTQLLPAWLTLFTYLFLHGSVFHMLTNMVCLWVFGILAEPMLGTKRFALTYLTFGVITGITIVAIIPHWTSPLVGASGSISGVLGAFLALHFSKRIGQASYNIAFLMLEMLTLLAIVAWFATRHIPAEPDLPSSIAWHVVPFLLGWCSVRTWKGLANIRRTKEWI